MVPPLYSDRVNGPPQATNDRLPTATARGLVRLVSNKLDAHWFATAFPLHCPDGNTPVDTNRVAFRESVLAVIPEAPWPLHDDRIVSSDEALFDLLEYCARLVHRPKNGSYHDYYRHHELKFDRVRGLSEFRKEVNEILQRGAVMFTMTDGGLVERTGTPEVQHIVRILRPRTGDDLLDTMLIEARNGYASHRQADRSHSLERLWDAFERLKSLEVPGQDKKRQSAKKLLSHVESDSWRAVLEADMVALTALGNDFHIRHFEVHRQPLPDGGSDYLFARMGNLIVHLLEASGRVGDRSAASVNNPFA